MEVAFRLRSKTSSRNVASELALLSGRVQNGDHNYNHYRSLTRFVIQKVSDLEIWSAVVDLITTLSRVTPPASLPTAFDDTPIIYSSASKQDVEQLGSW